MSAYDGKRIAAESLVGVLEDWGVDHVFICPGSTEAAFLRAVVDHPKIKVLLTTHESVTVAMADGYARATGRPAVAYLHANVGLTNGLSHLYAAQLAHSPVVILNGVKPTAIQSRGGFTTAPHMRDFVRQYVKWDWQVRSAEAVAEDVNRAFKVSTTEPPGPTWVGIAQDLLEAEVLGPAPEAARYRVDGRVRPPAAELRALADRLGSATRVVLVAGADVDRTGGTAALTELAELLGAPVLHEDRRTLERSVFPADHPCFAGMYAPNRGCVQDAEVIFFAGARSMVEFEPPKAPEVPHGATVVQLHSDPAEIARTFAVDVALVGDAALTLAELVERVRDGIPAVTRPDRAAHLDRARGEHRAVLDAVFRPPAVPEESIRVPDLMRELAGLLDEGTTVVGDATTSGGALLHALANGSAARVHTTSSGSLGWGVGAALGIAVAEPKRRVLAVLGDGVFQFGIPGLWTAVRYGIPVTFLVVNNQSYAAVGAAIRRHAGELSAADRALTVDLRGPRIAHIAEGFGVPARRIQDLAELPRLIKEGATATGPTLIEVMTDPADLGP